MSHRNRRKCESSSQKLISIAIALLDTTARHRSAILDLCFSFKAPPDVKDLTVTNVTEKSVTVGWKKPEGKLDRCVVEANIGDQVVRCAVLPENATFATCNDLHPCSSLSIIVWTQTRRILWWSSKGVRTNVTFVQGQAPDTPRNLSLSGKYVSSSLLQWEPPEKVHGVLASYWVNICDSPDTCPPIEGSGTCTELNTSETEVHFNSTAYTEYCTVLKASARCRDTMFSSLPQAMKFKTPVFEPGKFLIQGRALNSTSVEIVVHTPVIKNGPLDKCVGTLLGPSKHTTFACDNNGSSTAKVHLGSLHPGANYTCTVQFVNIRTDGEEMASSQSIWFVTPTDREESSPDSGGTIHGDARVIFLGLALFIMWQLGRP
ncbi:fibronectin-like isoform X2 [Amblyomma americanum]